MTALSIGDALFTKTQQRVLGLLYGRPGQSFYTNEIVRWADMGRGTIRRELDRLVSAGLLVVRREGNQHHYQANEACPVYTDLQSIVKKTFGISDVIRSALASLADQIRWSFIFGSVASGKETSTSDIDLMIIGDVGFTEAVSALYSVQETLGREINPKIFRAEEWSQMLNNKDAFIKEVLEKPRMDVMGDGHEFGKLSEITLMKKDNETLVIGDTLVVSRAALYDLAQRYHIRKLLLFGSAARGELKSDSDIDLLVEFEKDGTPSLGGIVEIQEAFSELFGGRKVDVATPSILNNPYRKQAIEKDMEELYAA